MSDREESINMPLDEFYEKRVFPKPNIPRRHRRKRNRSRPYKDLDYARDNEDVDLSQLGARRNWGQLKTQYEKVREVRPNGEVLAAGNNQQDVDPKSNREHQDLPMSMGASSSNQPQQLYNARGIVGGINSPAAYANPQGNWVRNPVIRHGDFNYNGWPNQQPANNQVQHGYIYDSNGVRRPVFSDLQHNPEQQQLPMNGNIMSAATSNQFQPQGRNYGMLDGMNSPAAYANPQGNWVRNPVIRHGDFNYNGWPNQQPANNQVQLGYIFDSNGVRQPVFVDLQHNPGQQQLPMNANIMSAPTSNLPGGMNTQVTSVYRKSKRFDGWSTQQPELGNNNNNTLLQYLNLYCPNITFPNGNPNGQQQEILEKHGAVNQPQASIQTVPCPNPAGPLSMSSRLADIFNIDLEDIKHMTAEDIVPKFMAVKNLFDLLGLTTNEPEAQEERDATKVSTASDKSDD